MSTEETSDKSDTLITELLANALAAAEPGFTPDGWRGNSELRAEWRKTALDLQSTLLSRGIRLKVSSSPQLQKALHDISVQPAYQAYDVLKEIQKS